MYKANTNNWYLERVLHLLAGVVVLVSIGLSVTLQNSWWLILAGLAGGNLFIFALSGFCIMAALLNKAGIKSECQLSGQR